MENTYNKQSIESIDKYILITGTNTPTISILKRKLIYMNCKVDYIDDTEQVLATELNMYDGIIICLYTYQIDPISLIEKIRNNYVKPIFQVVHDIDKNNIQHCFSGNITGLIHCFLHDEDLKLALAQL